MAIGAAGLRVVDDLRGTRTVMVETSIADLSVAPVDTADVWLRLHLLSHRLVAPRTVALDGIFGLQLQHAL